jgi:hypothetical protein
MSKNIQTIGINFRDGNGSGGNFGGGSSYQQEERKEAVQTTVPYNPPTFLGNNNMVQPYQSNLGTTGSMFGSSGGGYVGVAEYNYTRSNPHVGIGVHNWIPPELEQIQSIQTAPVPYVSKTPAYTAQEMVGWLEHMNNTQNLKFNLPYKEINLSGKSVTDEDMVFFASRMKNFAFHLDSLQLNHNSISDYGIQALFNCTFTVPLGRSVVHLTLNNCNFGDVGAELIAAYVRDGYMAATRTIDLHGNNVTKVGEEKLSFAVNNTPNESLAIVVEKHSNPSGVSNFFKKAFKYYTEAFAVKTKENDKLTMSIYGQDDWTHCNKLIADASKEMTVGFVKYANNTLIKQLTQKAPPQVKAGTVGAVFVVVSTEIALNVNVENLAYCLTAVNKKIFGDSVYDPKESFSSVVFMGNDGEHVDDF